MKRVFEIDVLVCPHCKGTRKLSAFLTTGLDPHAPAECGHGECVSLRRENALTEPDTTGTRVLANG